MTNKEIFEKAFPQTKQIGGKHYKNYNIQPYEFIRVLLFDKPISSAPYPIKHEHEIEDGDASKGWCLNFPLGEVDYDDNEKGFKKVDYVGTGFMCIERKVFEMLIEKFPYLKYKTDVRAEIDKKRESKEIIGNTEYAFFDIGAIVTGKLFY